nr:unnamed protein product [Spirometra erinaceieuropaei]
MWKGVRPGAEISFVYDLNENVDGEFICLDETRRVVLLRKPSKSGRQNTYDIFMYRLDYIKDLKSSNANPITNYPDLDLDKITARTLRNEKIERERLKLYEPGVSKDARELFEHFYKTLPTPPKWEKPNIQVFEQTIIKPPYTVSSVSTKHESSKAKLEGEYVKKLVEKFYCERNPGS